MVGVSPVKRVWSPAHNRFVALGCKHSPPEAVAKVPKLARLLKAQLPAPPSACSWLAAASQGVSQMYGNDQYGCCVPAGDNHSRDVFDGNAGDPKVATTADVLAEYSAITGFDPNDPSSDQGTDPLQAFDYYVKTGFKVNGDKLAGYVALDHINNWQEVLQSIYLFIGGVGLALDLPQEYVNRMMPTGNGFVWDVAGPPDPSLGHWIVALGFDSNGNLIVSTWGFWGTITKAAVQKYAVAGYAYISQAAINKAEQVAPNTISWTAMVGYLDDEGGDVPVPGPGPSPNPDPNPPVPPPAPTAPSLWWDFAFVALTTISTEAAALAGWIAQNVPDVSGRAKK